MNSDTLPNNDPLRQTPPPFNHQPGTPKPQPRNAKASNGGSNSTGKTVAAAAGGFVAGAAAGMATGVFASNPDNAAPEADTQPVPQPEEVILANSEGIRFAHVDADNFSDAFAQAREQVGPGGAFEYEGKIYGTYYADEWNEMSTRERADYQSRVNEIAPAHNATPHSVHQEVHVHVAEQHDAAPATHAPAGAQPVAPNAEHISDDPADNEVRVIGVETVQNDDGSVMNVALLESGDDQALLVDLDNDRVMDVLIHDDNLDGQITPEEMHDISDAGIHLDDLVQAQAAAQGDYLAASDDGMPDYINDADTIMEV